PDRYVAPDCRVAADAPPETAQELHAWCPGPYVKRIGGWVAVTGRCDCTCHTRGTAGDKDPDRETPEQ
ncbi:hypothetical protein WDH52_08950, partial [Streptomyces sp. TRM70308]|uniref:hypothetical protein n=1 Tax=Streptomyces sp. TRM70308 TaxID=3131932 RepID=UPI003D00AFEF